MYYERVILQFQGAILDFTNCLYVLKLCPFDYGLGLLCLTPLSTIFQLYHDMFI